MSASGSPQRPRCLRVTRGDRRGCEYAAYVPDPVVGRSYSLDGEVAADVADAEAAILQLNTDVSALANTEVIARLLLRAEAMASSRIEGLDGGTVVTTSILRADALSRAPHRCYNRGRRS
ncbi:MAG: hypothetical protein IBX63_11360 [Coriobacteriia bacterium]|nr:hypothetical protein [Coriobacteriia bacterium]